MVVLALLGMVISLVINLVFIPGFAERATAWAELMAELLVSCLAFFLARRCLEFKFPLKRFLFNLVLVSPFYPIVLLSQRITDNMFLGLAISLVAMGVYYIIYQFLIIRNELLLELSKNYIGKLFRRE